MFKKRVTRSTFVVVMLEMALLVPGAALALGAGPSHAGPARAQAAHVTVMWKSGVPSDVAVMWKSGVTPDSSNA